MRNNDEIIKELLRIRGIVSDEDIYEFLSDKPQRTYDPFLLHNMKAGVDLLLSEIKKQNKICIYGDYDADGVTSVSILLKGLSHITDKIFYYIPSRFSEGYGLNCDALDKIKSSGASLILTVDCGCVAVKEIAYAKSIGLKAIVTDHHTMSDNIPDCIVINPKHPESKYPYKELAGCGVAFKMLQAIQRTMNLPKNILNEVLELVAIGTIGDIVELKDENRTIVKYGTKFLNSKRSPAIDRLADAAHIEFINSESIAFGIVPRINAAGRINHASDAVKLFTSVDCKTIEQSVDTLIRYNEERKKLQNDAFDKCSELISGDEPFIMIKASDIHEGIAGIVAGKIKEHYNRPVTIVTPVGNGMLKGTGRSIEGINLYEILNESNYLFEKFGGHKGACGFLLNETNYNELKSNTTKCISQIIKNNPGIFDKITKYDMVLSPGNVNMEMYELINKLEPFGEGNPSPVFCLKDVLIINPSFMGNRQNHARFVIKSNDEYADCVLFSKAQEYKDILFSNEEVNVFGCITHQFWRGIHQVKIRVEEIELCK